MNQEQMDYSATPYDDVFRTLTNDCPKLILPLLNEFFHEKYDGSETISFATNELFLTRQDGKETKRITDSSFTVIGESVKNYHIECECYGDISILVRMFEYDAQLAHNNAELSGSEYIVNFPNSAVLFLMKPKKIEQPLEIIIRTPGGSVSYPIRCMSVENYSIEEIFERNLLFLVPYIIFNYKSRLKVYNEDEEKLKELKKDYVKIFNLLSLKVLDGTIDVERWRVLLDMSKKVLEHLAIRYASVKNEVRNIMGGVVLEYESKTYFNNLRKEATEIGRSEGQEAERVEGISKLVASLRKFNIPESAILQELVEKYMLPLDEAKLYL